MKNIVNHSIEEILGDFQRFYATLASRLNYVGIDPNTYEISHFAFRTLTYPEYIEARNALEKHATANLENVWNGRPISKILLKTPLLVDRSKHVPMIELIPPMHQCVYRMGLEHIGFVVGETVDEFGQTHRDALTGQQFQSLVNEPYFIRFDDFTNVKFYRRSLKSVCTMEGRGFEGFQHVEHWQG